MADESTIIPLSMLGLTADSVNAADAKGWTPLHLAKTVRFIEAGADLEAKTSSAGQTPLHLAAAAGHADLVPLLITPSTLEAVDSNNMTPLQLAVWYQELEAAEVLVAAGAALSRADSVDTPWSLAISKVGLGGAPDMPCMLLDAMKDHPDSAALLKKAVHGQQPGGVTALHTAASWGHQKLVAKLLEAGADRDAVTQLGATPLWCAAAAGHTALVPLLATLATISLHGPYLASPLSRAMLRGDIQMLTLLLQAVAKQCSKQQEQDQQQPQQQDHTKLVQLLATAYLSVTADKANVAGCSWLLEVVLDVLGPGVAGDMCQAVQQQLQEAFDDPQPQPDTHLSWLHPCKRCGQQVSYLAEALLLGWLMAEEKLHAARQPLVARLQRLVVPGVGAKERQQPAGTGMLDWQKMVLVKQAELAAGAGQQQEALRVLGEFAALHFQRQEFKASGQPTCITPLSSTSRTSTHSESISSLLCSGLQMAAYSRMGSACPNLKDWDPVAYPRTASFRPAGVYTTFLVAWGRALRQLQQLPQEVARTVVSAVKAAREHQEQQGLSGEEEMLCDDLLALLLLPPPLPADAAGAVHGA